MATISTFWFLRHLRADPGMFIMHYSKGKLRRTGPGLAYFYLPLSSGIAEVPLLESEVTFTFTDQLRDYQSATVQGVINYRVADPNAAANTINFAVDPNTGAWKDQPLEKLANVLSQLASGATRLYLATATVEQALTTGAEPIRAGIVQALAADEGLQKAGIRVASVRVLSVRATAELEKALQTPTREQIQQRADEATFQRRALAVEKERAIKENELATQVELARRNQELLERQGANEALVARSAAAAARITAEASAERAIIVAKSAADDVRLRAEGQAAALKIVGEAQAEIDRVRAQLYGGSPRHVLGGLAMLELAGKLQSIGHLNVTPSLAADLFGDLLREKS